MDIVQERRAEATAEALKHSIALRVLALRDGKQQKSRSKSWFQAISSPSWPATSFRPMASCWRRMLRR